MDRLRQPVWSWVEFFNLVLVVPNPSPLFPLVFHVSVGFYVPASFFNRNPFWVDL